MRTGYVPESRDKITTINITMGRSKCPATFTRISIENVVPSRFTRGRLQDFASASRVSALWKKERRSMKRVLYSEEEREKKSSTLAEPPVTVQPRQREYERFDAVSQYLLAPL